MAGHVSVLIYPFDVQRRATSGPEGNRTGTESPGPSAEPCCRAKIEFSLPNLASQLLRCGIGRGWGPSRLVWRSSLSRELGRDLRWQIVVAMNIH